MSKSKSGSTVPSRSWEWGDGMSTSGVHTSEGKLVWWTRPSGDGGRFAEMASEQSFDDFLESGTWTWLLVPEVVTQELRALLVAGR